MNCIVLAGGGSAGHIMPNIALLPELRKRFDSICYMGGANSLEEKIAKTHGIPFYSTEVVKFKRDKLLSNIKIPITLIKGINSAKKILREVKPSVVFLKGGYASLPTGFAAYSMKIPVICHESDMTLGLANKLLSRISAATFTSYKETTAYGNVVCVGTPIREEIFKGDKSKLINKLNLPNKPVILAVGGSLGSKAINDALSKALDELLKKYNVIHISGKDKGILDSTGYYNISFADNIQDYYALADVVVSRAGATACAELAAIKKKTVLIPLPKGASRGDQELNAEAYRKAGAAKVLLEKDLTKESLISAINLTFNGPSPKPEIKIASNVEIASRIAKYCR